MALPCARFMQSFILLTLARPRLRHFLALQPPWNHLRFWPLGAHGQLGALGYSKHLGTPRKALRRQDAFALASQDLQARRLSVCLNSECRSYASARAAACTVKGPVQFCLMCFASLSSNRLGSAESYILLLTVLVSVKTCVKTDPPPMLLAFHLSETRQPTRDNQTRNAVNIIKHKSRLIRSAVLTTAVVVVVVMPRAAGGGGGGVLVVLSTARLFRTVSA